MKSLIFGALGVFLMSGLAGFHDDALGGTLMIGAAVLIDFVYYWLNGAPPPVKTMMIPW